MEGKLEAQGNEGKEMVVVLPEMSIPELTRQLESGAINPASVDEKSLMKCALLMSGRGYTKESIAEILGASKSTVYRRLKKIRAGISLKLGLNFQKDLIAEVVSNWRGRCQRLLRISYSDEISPYEQARAIFMLHQAEMDGIALLEKLGYLSKEQGMADVKESMKSWEGVVANLKKDVNEIFEKLTPEQTKQVVKYHNTEHGEASSNVKKMIKDFAADNDKQKKQPEKQLEELVEKQPGEQPKEIVNN